MYELNILKLIFSFMIFNIIIVGVLINTLEKYLPVFIVRTFRYGKFAFRGKDESIIKPIEVPKAWFKHFYVFSSILSLIALYFVFGSYVFNIPLPFWLRHMVDCIGNRSTNRETAAVSLLAIVLLTIQCIRRFYDTHFVSIFSSSSKMNLTHYLVGFLHYFGAIFAILVEAPNFTMSTNKVYYFRFQDLYIEDFTAAIIFLWACYEQYESTLILANLRKNNKGKVVSDGHFLPEGGLFKYVSSPHNFSEVMMYLMLTFILWNNTTFKYVLAWVLTNQVETALLAHWWYKETFPQYPVERKAIIPYIL